jgi:hypothetical protein
MNSKELIIKKIEAISDEEILAEINRVLDFHSIEEDEYIFSPSEIELIKEAEIAIENGQVYSHLEVLEMSRVWLKK